MAAVKSHKKPQKYWIKLEKEEEKLGELHNACKKKMCESEEMRKERANYENEVKVKCDGKKEKDAVKCDNSVYNNSKYYKMFQDYVECGKKDNVCAKERAARKIKADELDAFLMTPEGQAYLRDNLKAFGFVKKAKKLKATKAKKNKKKGGAGVYKITNYTYKQAKRIGVVVKPSLDKTKKIDVYRTSKTGTDKKKNKTLKKIASVGAAGMNDFPTYIQKRGLAFAKTRRRLYKMRHEKDRHTKWSRGWLADKLLW
jgi:hypothetical protein